MAAALLPTLAQRVALQQRPERMAVMHQRWEDLLFLHWEIEADLIQRTLPSGLFVDRYEDKAYVAIVPFKMRGIRPKGLPAVPYLSNFLESNVRTYVHNDRGIPGVWFYSLDTDRWIAHWIAKRFFYLPYVWSRMSERRMEHALHYEINRRGEANASHFAFQTPATTGMATAGSLDFFLLERYLLYSYSPRTKQLFQGQVHHQPYPFAETTADSWDAHPIAWNRLIVPDDAPVHICYSPGVTVEVFAIEQTS